MDVSIINLDNESNDKVVRYTALDMKVIAVLIKRVDGWAAYIGSVEGRIHEKEYREVARTGCKLNKDIALAIFPEGNELGEYCH